MACDACKSCCHFDVCKIREEYEYLNGLYHKAMETYRPDYSKPRVSDIPYIRIPDLVCKEYQVDMWPELRRKMK